MNIVDHVDRTLTVEIMNTVELHRMGLWWHMLQHKQGHLAHHILSRGFNLIEFLRHTDTPLWHMGQGLWNCWVNVRRPYLDILTDMMTYARQAGLSLEWQRKMSNHMLWVQNLGNMNRRADGSHVDEPTTGEKAQQQEQGQCDGARSRVAGTTSHPTSSPVASTGECSPPSNSGESTPHTSSGLGDTSPQPNSAATSKPLSTKSKPLRGKGHPKRPNPYTKPKRGKA